MRTPWRRQIGPSCGLMAVRMVRDAFWHSDEAAPSLLAAAIERGITSDGEVFDVSDLQSLAHDECGLDGDVVDASPLEAWKSLINGHLCVLPYDAESGTALPTLLGGARSHYGVVVGACWYCASSPRSGELVFQAAERGEMPDDPDTARVFLLVQHSLSRRLAVAPTDEFFASNAQLASADTTRYRVNRMNLMGRMIVFRGMAKSSP